MIIHLMMQASVISCTFIMCYVGQTLIDEVYYAFIYNAFYALMVITEILF